MPLETYRPVVRVEIDGRPRTALGGNTAAGPKSSYSTATILLDPREGRPEPGQAVRVWAGFGSPTDLLFSGEVDVDGVTLAPNELEVRATGLLGRTREPIGSPPSIEDDGTAEPVYLLTWSGVTGAVIVGDILAAYGVAGADLQDSGRTFGNIRVVGLAGSDPGWSLIEELDEVEGYKTYDAPDGTIRRTSLAGIPAASGRVLHQGVDLYAGRLDESRTGTFNRVIATGLPQTTALGVEVVPAEELNAPSPYIPSPPTYRAYTFDSALLETAEECGVYCARKLGELNRLRGELPFELAKGDGRLRPGMTIGVESAILDARADARYWVTEVTHELGAGFQTGGTLLLASRGAGWSPNEAPVAIIALTMEIEVLSAGTVWVVFADGSASYDPDPPDDALEATNGIASYAWTGSPVGPATGAATPRATYVFPADPTGATITLTVTDVHLKSGSATVTITAEMVSKALRRDLWAAVTSDLLLTVDAGATWQSVGVAATVIAEIAHAEYQLAATAAGALHKVAVDDAGAFTVTPIATPGGVTAVSINLGLDGAGTGRCWAGCANGDTWLSPDDGLTWRQRGTIPAVGGSSATAVRHIEESPFAYGQLHAVAGPALWRSFDEGVTWEAILTYPDPALAGTRMASGAFGDADYHWATFAGTSGDAASRVQEAGGAASADWPAAAKPAQPTGLTMGVYAPELLLVDTVGGGRSWWLPDGAAGGELTARSYPTALGTPRHIIRDGRFDGIVYGAASATLFKTFDKFAATHALLDLTGAQSGMMVGYGRLRGAPRVPAALVISAWRIDAAGGDHIGTTTNRIIRRTTAGAWEALADHPVPVADHATIADFPGFVNGGADPAYDEPGLAALAFVRPLILAPDGALYTYCYAAYDARFHGANPAHANLFTSTDGGSSWAVVPGLAGVTSLAAGGDGALWAVAGNGAAIHRSTDGGATWAVVVGSRPAGYTGRFDPIPLWPWLDSWVAVAAPRLGGLGGRAGASCPQGLVTTANAFGAHVWAPLDQTSLSMGPPGLAATGGGDAYLADWHAVAPGSGAAVGVARLAHGAGTAAIPAPLATSAVPWRLAAPDALATTGGGLAILCGQSGTGVWVSPDGGFAFADTFPPGTLGLPAAAAAAAAVDPATGDLAIALRDPFAGAGTLAYAVSPAGGAWADITGALVASLGGVYTSHPSGMQYAPGGG